MVNIYLKNIPTVAHKKIKLDIVGLINMKYFIVKKLFKNGYIVK